MKLDTTLTVSAFSEVATLARAAEEIGFDALWSTEAQHEPFMPLAVAATATNTMKLGTAIAVAFPRSPMILAHTAWDLQASANGRFILGLGTQVKGSQSAPLQREVGVPGPEAARNHPRPACHLGLLAERDTVEFHRRVLFVYTHDSVL